MLVGDDHLVLSLVVGLGLPDAKRDGVGLAVRDVAVTTTVNDFGNTL